VEILEDPAPGAGVEPMSRSHPARVALVGCGAVARLYYAPALSELACAGRLRVDVLVDPDPGSAELLRTHFPGARFQSDAAGLTGDRVDLAIVASPPAHHATQTIRLLRDGVSVLCEKPMATSVADAEAMIAASESARRVLAVGLVRRFLPACQTVRALLTQGCLGELRSFRFAEGGKFRWPTRSAGYFRRGASSGGVLADIGSHLLDLLVWWMGEPELLRYEDDSMGGLEANCAIHLRLQGGAAGRVRLSRDVELPDSGCLIQGSKGWLRWSADRPDDLEARIEGAGAVILGRLHEPDPRRPAALPDRRARNFEQSFLAQLADVLDAVERGTAPSVTGRDALAGVRLVERCYRNRKRMPMGWLSDGERARAEDLAREESRC
jgi:predicted dehydrogenase